jgi:GNAT superfamily N-acetyltransferase
MNRSGVLIRPATEEDAPSVKSMAGLLATTYQIDGDAFDEVFTRIKDDRDARILVAVDELGLIIGYLLGFVHDTFFANGAVAWIEEMFVSDTARRSGVGSALEREFGRWARSRAAKLVALATRRATTFYTAIGYEESAAYFRRML